ncbi:hypothetical protein T02_14548 [Trichinella nativa]|uniref:Uncharacterized protein n=1 Tax=Trichinella nativa TaxID=6335 RepID=A0A0V1KW77_9BILA|nr:hypothetical protein T02_14548 [Trichinella nativa]
MEDSNYIYSVLILGEFIVNGRDVIVPLARGCAEFSYQGSNPEMKRKNRGAVPLCRALKQKLKFIHQDLGRPQIRDSFLQ